MSPLRLNGSTSGFTTLDAPAVAGSNTLVLPTGNGSSGQVLSTNGSGALSWITPGGGKILQVVYSSTTSVVSYTSSSTWTSSGLTGTITPASASNKVLILIAVQYDFTRSSSGGGGSGFKIQRGSTDIYTNPNDYGTYIEAAASGGSLVELALKMPINYLDSPSSVSSVTYTLYGKNYSAGVSLFQPGGNPSTMILMEVAA
jgi:hypothetical protein